METAINKNPASNSFYINLQSINKLQNTMISSFDIQEQLLMQQQLKQEKTEINISHFLRGVYIVKVYNDNNTLIAKF